MAKARFSRMCKMARELEAMTNPEDEIPAWTQDFIATAHDRLAQVYSYMEPRARDAGTRGASPRELAAIERELLGYECGEAYPETLAGDYLCGTDCLGAGAGAAVVKSTGWFFEAPRNATIVPPPLAKGGKPSSRIESPVSVTVFGPDPVDFGGTLIIKKPSVVKIDVVEGGRRVTKVYKAPKDVDEVYVNTSNPPVRVY
jgi:hypothetical protein